MPAALATEVDSRGGGGGAGSWRGGAGIDASGGCDAGSGCDADAGRGVGSEHSGGGCCGGGGCDHGGADVAVGVTAIMGGDASSPPSRTIGVAAGAVSTGGATEVSAS